MTDRQFDAVPKLSNEEIYAIKAVAEGTASAHEQQLTLIVITKKFSRAFDAHFVPGSFDQTAFLAGRAFVGAKITKIVKTPLSEIADFDPS